MSDERNDRPNSDDTPPPLVPPPVFSSRADDTTAVTSVDYPVEDENRQADVDRAAADARDLGATTEASTDADADADSHSDSAESVDARDEREADYAAVDEPSADAVEDHTVIRDSGDLEPESDPDVYPAAAVDREPIAYETARDETPLTEPRRDESLSETRAYDPVPVAAASGAAAAGAAASAPTSETQGNYPPAPAQQRVFTPPPVEPKKKGNRGVGALIAVLSVIVFAVVYAVIAALIIGFRAPQALGDTFVQFAVNPVFYVPAIIFIVAFVIVVLLANRAGWWAYVLGSLLVGALVYFGTIGVALLTDNVIGMTPQEAAARLTRLAVDPFIVTSALVAREVSLWTGAAIASRGRRVKAKNVVARDEYERLAADHRAEYERGYPTSA